jgi:hypothetical protein
MFKLDTSALDYWHRTSTRIIFTEILNITIIVMITMDANLEIFPKAITS